MSGLRRSSGLTNLVADTLRLRDLSGGILTLSDRGVVRNDASPAFQNLTVSGQSQLHDTTVFGSLTANSVNALASITSPYAAIGILDVSSASIDSLNVSSATVGSLDVSSATIGSLDISSATINSLNVSSAAIGSLDVSSATIDSLNVSSASIDQLDVSSATVKHADISSAVIDYLPQFDPSGNIFPIIPSLATLPQLIESYNKLITLFANRNIFLSLTTIYIKSFIAQTEYQAPSAPYIFVPYGSYFTPSAFGTVISPTAAIDISANNGFIVPYVNPGQSNVIYRSIFYLSPPVNILNMVLWVDCDDGCAIRITDPDTNITTDLINTLSAWRGGPGPEGFGPYRFPADAMGNGIFLNLYAGKYYKIECNSTNNSGADSCSFLYTIPVASSPPTPVSYTVITADVNAMSLMSGATVATTIPNYVGTVVPIVPTPTPIPSSWYYLDPL